MDAGDLSGRHIGSRISFGHRFPMSDVRATITGELREIHHDASGVTVWLVGDNPQGGEKTEFVLSPETEIR
jgi:hypothetical protein